MLMTDLTRELTDALRPFIDGIPATEHAKLIDKRYRGLNPIQVTVTKFQIQAAREVLARVGIQRDSQP